MTKVVLATRNHHKVEELRAILADVCDELGLDIVGLDEFPDAPDVVEDGVTFAQNAVLKAAGAAEATGPAGLADDSGLAVDVLGGAPGIFSARWSGAAGRPGEPRELLAQLGDVRESTGPRPSSVRPHSSSPMDGPQPSWPFPRDESLTSPAGTGGFGYDPIFVPRTSRIRRNTDARGVRTHREERRLHRAWRSALVPHLKEHLSQ